MELSYRQIHLDFHTSPDISGVGADFSPSQFQQMLREGHVSSVTVFSKCHHGYSYHPSRVNPSHPGLAVDDLLGEQIKAAHAIGVKTPVYISAGYDEKSARLHPEWIAVDRDGRFHGTPDFLHPGYHRLCFNSPYLEELAAEAEEVAREYDADGIFMDIVGVTPCRCRNCLDEMERRGIDPTDDGAVMDFALETYLRYTAAIRAAVDRAKPGLPLFHNAGHIVKGREDILATETHLELESLPTGGWGYDHFPLSASYARTKDKDFLGMTGKFHTSWGEFGGYKHPNALRYEAALAAANGAKCSVGDQLHPGGRMDPATYSLVGAAYAELEKKEPWLKGAENLADVALLSVEALANETRLTGRQNEDGDTGAARMLLEGHILFDTVDQWADFSLYKVLILPDGAVLSEKTTQKLRDYCKGGGKLLAAGASALNREKTAFVADLGAEPEGENPFCPDYARPKVSLNGLWDAAYVLYCGGLKLRATGKVLAERENPYFNRTYAHFCSHRHAPNDGVDAGAGITVGKEGAEIGWNIFTEYAREGSLIARELTLAVLNTLLGEGKTLETGLPAQGVVTLTDQKEPGRLICHLLYASPVQRGRGINVIEDILPLYQVPVSVKTDREVFRAVLAPQGEELPLKKENGKVAFVLPKLECHQMVALEYRK